MVLYRERKATMRVRLGYVAIALNLPKVTSSSTVTYTTFQKLDTEEKRINKLKAVTLSNLDDLYKILQYNVKKNIHFYRITSALVPLASHPEVTGWDYRKIFKKDFEYIGKLIAEKEMRVDTHPDEFNVINSLKDEVVSNTLRNLMIHVHLFEDLNYPLGKMVLHLGGAVGGRAEGMKRFINNLSTYPEAVSRKLMLENDDKTFTARDVLHVCRETKLPMVFDVHHHNCNNEGETVEELLGDIFNTWREEVLPPKFHFSSPREFEKDRKHADFINAEDFVDFLEKCKKFNVDMDVMLEAKQKDLSLFKLVEDIKLLRPHWNWLDSSTLEI
jgi:UV DNA damage endonuclease